MKFSTSYNAFAFSIIVASVPCISRVVAPFSCLVFLSAPWYCFVASSSASRWRCFTSRLLYPLLPLGRPPVVLSSSALVVVAPIVVPVAAAVSLLPPEVSNVNAESVEVLLDSPPLLAVASTSSSADAGLAAPF